MITEELISYVESKILTDIHSFTLVEEEGSLRSIRDQYRLDYGKTLSAILLHDVINILKLKYDSNRNLKKKVVIDSGVLRNYPG